jgi:hypothetical protein
VPKPTIEAESDGEEVSESKQENLKPARPKIVVKPRPVPKKTDDGE